MEAFKRKKRNTLRRSILKKPGKISTAEVFTFGAMRARKLERKKYGPTETYNNIHLILYFVFLMVSLTLRMNFKESSPDAFIQLNVEQSIAILVYMITFALISMLISNRFKTPFYIAWLYIPLIHMVVFFILTKVEKCCDHNENMWFYWSIIISELILLAYVIARELLYPIFKKPEWIRATSMWSIKVITPWTMAYRGTWGRFGPIHTCMYDGEKDEEGYPHGTGRWFDDMYGGEILSGRWEKGIPVAPYVSRTYGQGDGFAALQIAYFVATDDSFSKSSGTPSNENEPKLGVATVECSVNGNFYSHLPLVKEGKVLPVSNEDGCVSRICEELVHLEVDKNELKEVDIRIDGSKRLQVRGHVHSPTTGSPRSLDSEKIIVNVQRHNAGASKIFTKKRQFMARVPGTRTLSNLSGQSFRLNSIRILQCTPEEDEEKFLISDVKPQEDNTVKDKQRGLDMPQDSRSYNNLNALRKVAKLEVRDWTRNQLKEALIFFPGFNSSMEKSLKSLGQCIALSQLDRHIYPILYAWPSGTLPSYRSASNISATQKNKDNFNLLLRGLQDEGIYTVHIMGHSMGTQSLLAMFEDKYDNNLPSRSDASMMFQHDPAFSDDTEVQGTGKELMVCKNIIFMNPDFPVEAFVDRAFLSIRRVCQNITLLGDRKDVALMLGSKLINGACNKLGYIQPDLLRSNKSLKSHSKEFQYHTIGTDIDLLYFPEAHDDMNQDQKLLDKEIGEKNPIINNALIFDSVAPIHCTLGESCIDKQWLDIDVIDTTSLDTNVAGVRHGGFHVNPIIIKDLEELIVGGHRAHLRLSLLNREGNLHTYSHAPAHVTL